MAGPDPSDPDARLVSGVVKALWRGRCPVCGRTWRKGSLITLSAHRTVLEGRCVWQHGSCPNDP